MRGDSVSVDPSLTARWLAAADSIGDARLMAATGVQLTIAVRIHALDEAPLSWEQVRGFNELHHTLYGQLRRYLRGDAHTYPLETLATTMTEIAAQFGCSAALAMAMDQVAENLGSA